MMKINNKQAIGFAIIMISLSLMMGCAGNEQDHKNTISGTTQLLSTHLTAASTSGFNPTPISTSGSESNMLITPSNISGKVLSVDLNTADPNTGEHFIHGIGVMGHDRPDIALATATFYDFDFSTPTAVSKTDIEVHESILDTHISVLAPISFGHIDVTFKVDNITRVIRVAMCSRDGMERGDKLLIENSVEKWYDMDSEAFTTTRPNSPNVIASIRDFVDTDRPDYIYYPMNTNFTATQNLTGLSTAQSINVQLDYAIQNFVVLEGLSGQINISTANIIKSFNISQVVNNFAETGLSAEATITISP